MDYLIITCYILAGFGLTILLLLAAPGGSLVFQAIRFAVTLAFAEHKAKRLRKASSEARDAYNSTHDNADKNQASTPKPPQGGGR